MVVYCWRARARRPAPLPTQRTHARQRGFTLIELLIVIAIILIIVGIAVPKLGSARMTANETAVINEIRTIHTAEQQYLSQFGKFATTLAELGPPASGGPGPTASDLIPASLASGEKDGYTFVLTTTPQGYNINANPKVYNTTGRRTFFSDQTMVIRQTWSSEPSTAASQEMK
jgi:type IV pilus assembly protein PilA